jgi:hypothetical protein
VIKLEPGTTLFCHDHATRRCDLILGGWLVVDEELPSFDHFNYPSFPVRGSHGRLSDPNANQG